MSCHLNTQADRFKSIPADNHCPIKFNKTTRDEANGLFNLALIFESMQYITCSDYWHFKDTTNKKIEQNAEKAFTYFQKAAELGHAQARTDLVAIKSLGLNLRTTGHRIIQRDLIEISPVLTKDESTAAEELYQIGKAYHEIAQSHINFLKKQEQNRIRIFLHYQKAADLGNAEAQCRLAEIYNTVPASRRDEDLKEDKNDEKSFEYYKKAADAGIVRAQTALGTMYRKGQGVEQDPLKALECYKKAADQDDKHAHYYLGKMHEKGIGTKQDVAESLKHYTTAAIIHSKTSTYALYDKDIARVTKLLNPPSWRALFG